MEIALIAPYEKMAELSRKICTDLQLDIAIYTGNMEDGLTAALEAERQGASLLISRGLTAQLIRQHLTIPVVEISISAFDLYLSILPYIGTEHNIGIIGHKDIVTKAEMVRSMLGVSIDFIELTTQDNILKTVQVAKAQGVTVLAEAMSSHSVTRTNNITSIVIESGEDSITNAIQYAVAIHAHLVQKNVFTLRLQSLLDAMAGGALISNSEGHILHANTQAKRFLGERLIRYDSIQALFPDLPWQEAMEDATGEHNIMVQAENTLLAVCIRRHEHNGSITHISCTFNEARQIEQIEKSFRREQGKKTPTAKHSFDSIIYHSSAMETTIRKAKRYSQTDSSILLVGETGTGKELFAQSIHNHSGRRNNNFIAINCGAMAEDLLESELFGYEEGAFTGAVKGGKPGVFELAHQGTLFLDEVNATSPKMQTRLLRTLQEREVRRVGSTKTLPVDVRVIAASNAPLEREMEEGRFRSDLFFRLNVLDITIPPLVERKEDIVPLFTLFFHKHCLKNQLAPPEISTAKREELKAYRWPGNVRELQNHAEKYAILYPDPVPVRAQPKISVNQDLGLSGSLEEITGAIIHRVLKEEGGNISQAARRLKINRNTFKRRLEKEI